jgi:hypothetical protein
MGTARRGLSKKSLILIFWMPFLHYFKKKCTKNRLFLVKVSDETNTTEKAIFYEQSNDTIQMTLSVVTRKENAKKKISSYV